MRTVAVIVYATCVLSFASGGPEHGGADTGVSGFVHGASGSSVAHASIEAVPVLSTQEPGTIGHTNPWIAADSDGRFNLKLPPGRYRIRAKDERDGYPDPSFWVNLDPSASFPEINVGDSEVRGVEVVLGKQGGFLSGTVQDAQTRKPLAGAKIRIQDVTNVNAYLEIFADQAGHFLYTVPSKPILISVAASGYKGKSSQKGLEVDLSPGERRELQLEMERE
ncbi:MAG: carboxypeptidase regulatory-like domain-containing protein [Terriglobales bacterium]